MTSETDDSVDLAWATDKISSADVGNFFRHKQEGDVYQCIGYTREPSVILERVRDGKRTYGGVSGLQWDDFRRLVEQHDDERDQTQASP